MKEEQLERMMDTYGNYIVRMCYIRCIHDSYDIFTELIEWTDHIPVHSQITDGIRIFFAPYFLYVLKFS